LFIGLMTGTSMDGVDAALVRVNQAGDVRFVHGLAHELPNALTQHLHHLAGGEPVTLDLLCEIDAWLGQELANAATGLLQSSGHATADISAIGSHGQTLHHRPQAPHASTLQIGDPNIIAEMTGVTTVADLRRRDMAAGGQGAPLLPALHAKLFGHADEDRVVINLGGIANVTVLPAGESLPSHGFDTGPANTLLDGWCRRNRDIPFDSNGDWAASGQIQEALLQSMLEEPYFHQTPPKSTGRELFNLGWVDAKLAASSTKISAADVQRTLVDLTVRSITNALTDNNCSPARVIVCGGGVHNSTLMASLRAAFSVPVESAHECGVDADFLEAMAFGWLAYARLTGKSVLPPQLTGASHPIVLGGIYSPAV
jgi:anhydro-N-acetylmuramic acid kinase